MAPGCILPDLPSLSGEAESKGQGRRGGSVPSSVKDTYPLDAVAVVIPIRGTQKGQYKAEEEMKREKQEGKRGKGGRKSVLFSPNPGLGWLFLKYVVCSTGETRFSFVKNVPIYSAAGKEKSFTSLNYIIPLSICNVDEVHRLNASLDLACWIIISLITLLPETFIRALGITLQA